MDVTPDALRGLIVPMRLTPSRDLSSVTEESPIPGTPVPDAGTPDALSVSGVSEGYGLEVRVHRAGDATTARLGWRYDGDALWRGWDPPIVLSGWERVVYSTSDAYRSRGAAALPDGSVVVVADTEAQAVVSITRSPSGVWGSPVTIYAPGDTYGDADGPCPCLCLLPSGRLLCLYVWERGSTHQIRVSYSDDSGATWETLQRATLGTPIARVSGTTVKRIAATATPAGHVVVVVWAQSASEDYLYQYASGDGGASLTLIGSEDSKAYPALASTPRGVVLAWLAYSAVYSKVVSRYVVLASAYDAMDDSDAEYITAYTEQGAYSGGIVTAGELSLTTDEAGRCYAVLLSTAPGVGDLVLAYTDDASEGWRTYDYGTEGIGCPWTASGGAHRPYGVAAAWVGGRILIACDGSSSGIIGAPSLSLSALWLGGWTTLEIPPVGSGGLDTAVSSWSATWAPIATPPALGWVEATTGTASAAYASTGVTIATASASTLEWSRTVTTDFSDGVCIDLACTVASGTAYVGATISDGLGSRHATITITPSSVALRAGATGGTIIGSSVATTEAGTGIRVRLVMQGSTATAWYTSSTSPDAYWQEIASGEAALGATPSSSVRAGAIASSSVTAQGLWYAVGDLQQSVTSPSLPSDLRGRQTGGAALWLTGGTYARLTDGPVVTGDAWTVPASAEYPLEAIATRSPRHAWRSQSDGADQEIVWEVSSTVLRASPALGRVWGLHLTGVNFQSASLYGRSSAGSWVLLASISTDMGTGLHYTRTGDVVYANGGPKADHPIPENALANCYFQYVTNGNVRRITGNSGGIWGGSASATQAMLRLDGVLTGDASSGSDGAIYSDRVTVLYPGSTSQAYSAFKLTIPAQGTAEGYFTIGAAVLGRFVPFARQYSWGRELSWESGVEVVETVGGARRALQRRPMRRSVRIAWPDGVDTRDAHQGTPAHVHLYTSGPPIAAPAETAYAVPGLYEVLSGSLLPVVYLARVETQGSQTAITIPHRWLQLYGSILTDTLQIDSIIGSEWEGEVMRIGQVEISEEV